MGFECLGAKGFRSKTSSLGELATRSLPNQRKKHGTMTRLNGIPPNCTCKELSEWFCPESHSPSTARKTLGRDQTAVAPTAGRESEPRLGFREGEAITAERAAVYLEDCQGIEKWTVAVAIQITEVTCKVFMSAPASLCPASVFGCDCYSCQGCSNKQNLYTFAKLKNKKFSLGIWN